MIRSRAIRQLILGQAKRANVGGVGSSLSVADIVAVLFGEAMCLDSLTERRDRFVLSKGHAALAVYAALHITGKLSTETLNTFCGDGSHLGVHPVRHLDGIDFSTGSLGHGLSIGAGAALAGRLQKSQRRVFVLVSDAECDEGSLWEAVMFSAHHRLAKLIAIVDMNGQQSLGYTKDVLSLSPMADRWRAFGWDTWEVDGHSRSELSDTFRRLETNDGPPHVVLAHTKFGCGVSFMESQIRWHYMRMSDSDYARAINEVSQSCD